MIAHIKARFTDGAIVPLEPLNIEEGTELSVAIDLTPRLTYAERLEITKSAAGGWKGLHDPEELKRTLYEARITGSRERPLP